MSAIKKILLTSLFVPILFLFVLSITVKFKFLSENFWTSIYTTDFYQGLIDMAKRQEPEFNLSPDIAKETGDRNIQNAIFFLNGKRNRFYLYVPKGLDLSFSGEEIPLDTLLDRYTGFNQTTISYLDYFNFAGFYSNLAIIVLTLILLLISWGLKKRLSVPLIISSVLIFLLALLVQFISVQWERDLIPKNEGAAILLVPVFKELAKFWSLIGSGLFILALVVIFFPPSLGVASTSRDNSSSSGKTRRLQDR